MSRYLEELEAVDGKVDGLIPSKCTISTPGSDAVLAAPTAANITSGPGRQSHCEAYRAVIEAKLEAQLHAKRIWQDLVDEHGFEHS